MPVACVDCVVKNGNKFLLEYRVNKPAQHKWWLPGGRILKGESLTKAVYRKLKDETGLNEKDVGSVSFLTVKDVFYPTSEFDSSMHNINLIYKIRVKSPNNLRSDSQHSSLKWFSSIDKKWPSYVKFGLKLAGFK